MAKREETAAEDTWKLEDMLGDDTQWEELFSRCREELEQYDNYKGRLGESPDVLLSCLQADDRLSMQIEVLYVYSRMRLDEDTARQKYQDMFGRARMLSNEASERSSFITPEILNLPSDLLREFMESDNGIGQYQRALEVLLAKKDHTLSADMEELLARSCDATQGASQIFQMFNNADVEFPAVKGKDGDEIRITHGNFIPLLESGDRLLRRNVFQGLYGVYQRFGNTLAATFEANVKQAAFYARARHYRSSRQRFLADNEIPEKVYDQLVDTVRSRLPHMHDYVRLRKQVLGVEELHMYDLYTPMVQGASRTYSFDEAKGLVKEGLKPMGEAYGSILQEGFDNRWIDVYENQGKRSGAYSWGTYRTHPYVLMNYKGTLDHVFTLAHEMGHAIHSYYSNQSQPYVYAGYKIFVAEVASTCNEALLNRYLLDHAADSREKCYLLNHFLDSFKGTLFRQTMFAEFEAAAHQMAMEGQPLTRETLCGLYHKLNEDYFGPDMTVDGEIDYEWARIPHFYTPFYVYQYATGFSAAIAISARILKGEPGIIERYRQFLSGGCSMSPIELLRLCGVDMEGPEPVSDALDVFASCLDELRSLLA